MSDTQQETGLFATIGRAGSATVSVGQFLQAIAAVATAYRSMRTTVQAIHRPNSATPEKVVANNES